MVELSWLIKLRWLAVFGQLLLILLASRALVSSLPFAPLIGTIALIALSNLALQIWKKAVPRSLIGAVILFDICALTALLYFSGGANNPFSFFYVVHVALGAFLLGERWSWFLAALSTLLYGALFFFHTNIPELSSHGFHSDSAFSLHLQGMWIAFALVSAILSFFFTRLLKAISQREEELRQSEVLRLKHERLAAVTALAASAAHELNTPLATIGIAAEEIAHALGRQDLADNIGADAALILREVRRCAGILGRIRNDAGETQADVCREIPTEQIYAEIRDRLAENDRPRFELTVRSKEIAINAPQAPLVEALLALTRNALEASTTSAVTLDCSRIQQRQELRVIDQGKGIPKAVRDQIGEPFFSTKAEGKGLGLGVFLAQAFAERMHGALKIDSEEGSGTIATLQLPVTALSHTN